MKSTALLFFFFISSVCGASFWVREFNGSDGFVAARTQAAGCLHAPSNKYYFIGGINGTNVNSAAPTLSSVIIYDLTTKSFSYGPAYPYNIASLACVFVGDNLWAYGGAIDAANRVDLTTVLDVSAATPTWQNVSTGSPPFRSFHSMSAIGTKIYLQGGGRGSAGITFNDSYVFDTVSRTWAESNSTGIPVRAGSAAGVWNDTLYVFGGRNRALFYDDIWSYSPASNVWNKLITTGPSPTAKVAKGAVSEDGKFWIYSGGNRGIEVEYQEFHYLDLTTLVWTRINETTTAADGVSFPGKRSYYNSWVHNNKLYVALGAFTNGVPSPTNTGAYYNDVWSLDISSFNGSTIPTSATAATSLTANSASTSSTATSAATSSTATSAATSQSTNSSAAVTSATGGNSRNTNSDPMESNSIRSFISIAVLIVIAFCL